MFEISDFVIYSGLDNFIHYDEINEIEAVVSVNVPDANSIEVGNIF